jgi:hypothetical protein
MAQGCPEGGTREVAAPLTRWQKFGTEGYLPPRLGDLRSDGPAVVPELLGPVRLVTFPPAVARQLACPPGAYWPCLPGRVVLMAPGL